MDTLGQVLVLATLISPVVLAYPRPYSNKDDLHQGALDFVLRLLEQRSSINALQELNAHKDKLEEIGKDLQESGVGEVLEQKTKKSPLYRLTGPINRQTRLASFGSLILPKYTDSSSRNVLRYGK